MAIGGALLGLATGAANVINKDAEKDREFMRRQKVKIADSRLVRKEKEYDARKAKWDMVQQYGTDRKGQYMHAWNIFKDHAQSLSAMESGIFKKTLEGVQDPGTFTPYDVGVVTDEEVRALYGDDSIAGKLLGAFGNTKSRRAEQRDGQVIGRNIDMEALSDKADQALKLGDFATVQKVTETGTSLTEVEQAITGTGEKITTTQHNEAPTAESNQEDSFYTVPPIVDIQREGGQIIVTTKDGRTGQVISSKATAIENYRTFTRPEVDLKSGRATWSETTADGEVTTFSGPITGLPEEALEGFSVNNATYSKDLGGYTILEQNEETKEFKTTFLKVEGVPKGLDQSKVKWLGFKAVDTDTGETVQKYAAVTIVDGKITPIDSIQVTTSTSKSSTPQPSNADARNRAFSKLAQAKASGGDIGDALAGFSDDQLRALAVDVGDEAIKMSKNPQFADMNFGQIEQQAILRVVRAEALRQKLRAGKQE